ncbi:hypothetical protein [Jiangella gansuensis]|uniref:hypothetical protein n=1 Tax=Jiangella gansuensis TaxID=281473 RepID=UPI0004B0F7F0|nr:hypothetical protein [Jiangella gansuensis]
MSQIVPLEPPCTGQAGALLLAGSAHTTAALAGIDAMAITTLTSLALARRRSSGTNP